MIYFKPEEACCSFQWKQWLISRFRSKHIAQRQSLFLCPLVRCQSKTIWNFLIGTHGVLTFLLAQVYGIRETTEVDFIFCFNWYLQNVIWCCTRLVSNYNASLIDPSFVLYWAENDLRCSVEPLGRLLKPLTCFSSQGTKGSQLFSISLQANTIREGYLLSVQF